MGRKRVRKSAPVADEERSESPWPAPPHRPAKYWFNCYNGRTDVNLSVGWGTIDAAGEWLKLLCGNEKVEWTRGRRNEFTIDGGEIVVQCEQLEEVYEHSGEFEMPEPYGAEIEAFLTGDRRRALRAGHEVDGRVAAKTPQRRPVAGTEGFESAASIAATLGMKASEARGVLRAAGEAKPEGGWVWKVGEEVERIKVVLRKGKR